jgi:hypothetical protein
VLAPELAALPGSSVPHLGQRVISSPSQVHLRTRKPPTLTTAVRNLLPQLGQGVSIPKVFHAGSCGSWPDLCNPICTNMCTSFSIRAL